VVREPKAFLFDEPLSNLDASLRAKMRAEIAALHRRLSATMIYVTHDQHEAMTLADRLVLLDKGRIVQEGAPLSVYDEPATRFAAEFLGSPAMNFLPVARRGDALVGEGFSLPVAEVHGAVSAPESVELWLGIRPESLTLAQSSGPIAAVTDWVERTGSDGFLYAKVGETPLVVRLPADAAKDVELGKPVRLACAEAHLFERQSGRALS
jgi:multiple sugar transport system ATP-binding protein